MFLLFRACLGGWVVDGWDMKSLLCCYGEACLGYQGEGEVDKCGPVLEV